MLYIIERTGRCTMIRHETNPLSEESHAKVRDTMIYPQEFPKDIVMEAKFVICKKNDDLYLALRRIPESHAEYVALVLNNEDGSSIIGAGRLRRKENGELDVSFGSTSARDKYGYEDPPEKKQQKLTKIVENFCSQFYTEHNNAQRQAKLEDLIEKKTKMIRGLKERCGEAVVTDHIESEIQWLKDQLEEL